MTLDPRAVAHALGGSASGRRNVLAPGPGHSHADRSLSIQIDPAAPDGFRLHSFASDDWRECRDYVRRRLGLAPWEGRRANLRAGSRTVASSSLISITPVRLSRYGFGTKRLIRAIR
jgi:hypothetical protein